MLEFESFSSPWKNKMLCVCLVDVLTAAGTLAPNDVSSTSLPALFYGCVEPSKPVCVESM